jgi:hypothetical protein
VNSQQNLEVSSDKFSNRDLARLRTNDPRLANRFIELEGIKFPILHLSLADLDIFRALTEKLDDLFSAIANETFFKLLNDQSYELIDFMNNDIPVAASLTLHISAQECKLQFSPITLLRVVMKQWLHNFEIDRVQKLFPMPKDDENHEDLPEQPQGNPCSMDERLCSNFHWTLEQSQAITFPQAYLISNESAWSYAKIKANSDNPKGKKVTAQAPSKKGAKRFIERFGDTPQEQAENYRKYMEEQMGGATRVKTIGKN